jgi:hypothetical protein
MEYPTPHRDEQGRFAKRPKTRALIRESTGEQVPPMHQPNVYNPMLNGTFPPMVEGGMLWGNGGTYQNPMAFPGYGSFYMGSYSNYRLMLQHPILRLVRSVATADILCNKWEYITVNGGDKGDASMVQDMLDPIRSDLMNDFYMRGRDYGWQGGELIWELRNSRTWLQRVKPLLVDYTECLRDESGDFSGLVNRVPEYITSPGDYEVRVAAPYKAWKYTYDSEAGYLYGRSWLENVRLTAWRDWLDCAQQLQKLGAKITGIQLILTHPAGTFPGPVDPATGKPTQISYAKTCQEIIKALANGAPGACLPSLNLPIDVKGRLDTAKVIAELAQKSLIKADLLNHGTNTPAIVGLLERMRHDEELMFAGGMRPASVGMKNEDGKANTGEHKDTSSKVSQLEDQDFARQLQSLVNAILVINRGPLKRNTVMIAPPSIVDNKRAYVKAILLAAMNDPTIAREMLRVIDVNQELANIDIRTVDQYSADRIEKADKAAADMKAKQTQTNTNKQPKSQGGRPTKKEGGNPKSRPQPARKAA